MLARIPAPASFACAAADASFNLDTARHRALHAPLFTQWGRRYNEFVKRLPPPPGSFLAVLVVILFPACWLAGCATPFGPGYVVRQQEIRVNFSPQPEPRLQISAEYRVQNTGNQPIDSLDVRLPGGRYRPTSLEFSWDAAPLSHNASPDNPRDTELRLDQLWKIGETHALKLSYELPPATGENVLSFSEDAFYLPSQGWTPQLPQARGLFGFGGVPPEQWTLVVMLPPDFLVHASGEGMKRSATGSAVRYSFRQTSPDQNPFVIAGKYVETRQTLAQGQTIHIWTRGKLDAGQLAGSGESLSRTVATYDALFGTRPESRSSLWVVECPMATGCVSQRETSYAALLYGSAAARSAELISQDSVLVDPRVAASAIVTSAGPALAAGWLGYGQNPGFYEQQPPASALPAFAAALAREATSGAEVHAEIIQRALAAVPDPAPAASNADPAVTRAKSLLLFYALRDKVGSEAFQKGIQHMLYARQRRGFNVTDLIASLEQESHQPIGPFVRQWIKRPGIPAEFRSRYAQSDLQQQSLLQETTR
jgi:hypothetical protein